MGHNRNSKNQASSDVLTHQLVQAILSNGTSAELSFLVVDIITDGLSLLGATACVAIVPVTGSVWQRNLLTR